MSRKLKEKARDRVSREKNSIEKKTWTGRSVVLVYPNSYQVGMGNLGFQKVYAVLNSLENVYCHRCFLPDPEDSDLLKKQGVPLFSHESQTPLSHYDIVAFSVTFEMDYLHVLQILDLAHIPLRHVDRGEKDPFILVGGVCPSFNPEPLAIFADAFAIGEGEELLPEFFRIFDKRLPKADLLKSLAGIKGMYVPSGYEIEYNAKGAIASIEAKHGFPEKVQRRWLKDMDRFPTSTVISAPEAVFGDMHVVEINRGCGRHCRFCLAGYLFRPPRFYSLESIKSEINRGLKYGKRIGLLGSACCDHTGIVSIARYIVESGGGFSLSSLRLESIPDGLIELLADSGHRTVTVAPEAGTGRLRSAINKPLGHVELMGAVEKIFSRGVSNLKLYFLIGLPSEIEEDVDAISSLARDICAARERLAGAGRGLVTISVNPFVPKPFTPFQRVGMEGEDSLKRKLKRIKEGLKGVNNLKLIHEKPKWSLLQGLLSRGDRRAGDLLLKVHESGDDWRSVIRKDSWEMEFYALRDIPEDEVLPWDMLDCGVKREYLEREFQNFSSGKATPPCPTTTCYRCGDFEGM